MQRGLDARCKLSEEGLGHVHKNAHPVDVGDLEHGAPRVAPCVDEVADVDVARCHHAVERRFDFLERGQLLKPLHCRLLSHHIRLSDREPSEL